MKIIVLGGEGFIGYNFVKKISNLEHNIYSFDRLFSNGPIENINYINGDYTKIELNEESFKNVDIVYHFISTTLPKASNLNPIFDIESNLCSLIKLLEICKKNNVKKIVFLSSGGTVYGNSTKELIDENHSTNPLSSYGIVKLSMEKYIQLYSKLYGINYSIFRLSNPYGPFQNSAKEQGVIGIFLKRILENQNVVIWGDGSVVRDYIYIDDVIEALKKDLILNSFENNIFNLGSGTGISLNEILEFIKKNVDKNFDVIYEKERDFDIKKNILDIKKIKEKLNWSPKIKIKEGIEYTLNWMKVDS